MVGTETDLHRCGCSGQRLPRAISEPGIWVHLAPGALAGGSQVCYRATSRAVPWSYVADAGHDPKTGKRRQLRASGFATKAEAEQALAELVDSVSKGTLAHDERQTLAHFWRNGSPRRTQRTAPDHAARVPRSHRRPNRSAARPRAAAGPPTDARRAATTGGCQAG